MLKSQPDPDYAQGSHYEKRDVSLPVLTKWIFFLFIFIGFSAFLAWGSYVWFLPKGRDRLALEPLSPTTQRPPSPLLQAYPKVEMREYRVKENAAIASYGWVKKEQGQVHIPIEEAVKLISERGLPTGQAPVRKDDAVLRPGIKRENPDAPPAESTPPSGSTGIEHSGQPESTGTAQPGETHSP